MKLVSFVRNGRVSFGAVVAGGIVDLGGRLGDRVATLRDALEAGLLGAAARYIDGRTAEFALSDVALLPVVPDPQKILCVGLNYETHRVETGRSEVAHPAIFTRFEDSQVGHQQALVRPKTSHRFDYEGELVVVIGTGGRRIDEARALEHVAGWSCYNDASVRDYQRHTHQFVPGKTFPGTGAFGPWLVTADEAGDHRQWPIETRLNGEVMQKARLSDLIFPVARIIAYVSEFTPLSPGDVILTGTPGGVGDKREPPVYLKAGDVIEVEVGPLGVLRNPVIDEA